MKRNIKLLIEYDGTRYAGWQRLGKSSNQNTIQGKIEEVLRKMTGEEIDLAGSGRTDAGVHALGQVANFHSDTNMTCADIKDYINRFLPQDIAVIEVKDVSERFHSRLNAKEKTYVYRIDIREPASVFDRKYMLHCSEQLDVVKMQLAADYLLGCHDFKGFSSIKKTRKSTIRTIYSLDLLKIDGQELQIVVCGNGFLHNMVRIIAGTLIEIGKGNKEPKIMKEILENQNRELAGPIADPGGLFMKEVIYLERERLIDI